MGASAVADHFADEAAGEEGEDAGDEGASEGVDHENGVEADIAAADGDEGASHACQGQQAEAVYPAEAAGVDFLNAEGRQGGDGHQADPAPADDTMSGGALVGGKIDCAERDGKDSSDEMQPDHEGTPGLRSRGSERDALISQFTARSPYCRL